MYLSSWKSSLACVVRHPLLPEALFRAFWSAQYAHIQLHLLHPHTTPTTNNCHTQTGAGKTYTMNGPHELDLLSAHDPAAISTEAWANVGVVPHARADQFKVCVWGRS